MPLFGWGQNHFTLSFFPRPLSQLLISCVISSKDHRFSSLSAFFTFFFFTIHTHTHWDQDLSQPGEKTTRENIFAAFYKYLIIFSLHFGMNFFLFFFSSSAYLILFALTMFDFLTLSFSLCRLHSFSFVLFKTHLLAVRFAFKSHNHKHSQLFAVCGIESTSWFYVVSLWLLFCHTLNYLAIWVLPVTISLKGLKTEITILKGLIKNFGFFPFSRGTLKHLDFIFQKKSYL